MRTCIENIINGERKPGVFFFPLYLAQIGYRLSTWFKNWLYDTAILTPSKIDDIKIISVGNLNLGGKGKTPMTVFLARLIKELGFKVAVLSRGYGVKIDDIMVISDGKRIIADPETAPDEGYMIATIMQDLPMVSSPDRIKAARFIKNQFNTDFILLDDGFQHRKIKRDLDLVMMTEDDLTKNKRLFPLGELREPMSSLDRADCLIVTVPAGSESVDRQEIKAKIRKLNDRAIIVFAEGRITGIISVNQNGREFDESKKSMTLTGIAAPSRFESMLSKLGINITSSLRYRDHHRYTSSDIQHIIKKARDNSAEQIITTQKDIVKLIGYIDSLDGLDLYYTGYSLAMIEGESSLVDIIKNLIR